MGMNRGCYLQMSGTVGAKRTSYFVDPSMLDLSLILPLPLSRSPPPLRRSSRTYIAWSRLEVPIDWLLVHATRHMLCVVIRHSCWSSHQSDRRAAAAFLSHHQISKN